MLAPLILLLLYLFSCGGKSEGGTRLELNIVTPAQEPYYTEIRVRVSGFDMEPVEQVKRGVFYPGDRVPFDFNLPKGVERHVEAVILDPNGSPAFYGRKTLDLSNVQRVVMDMLGTDLSVVFEEPYLEGRRPLEGVEFYLLSEDLYSLNGAFFSGKKHYWVGSYVAYRDDEGFLMSYVDLPGSYFLRKSRTYTIPIKMPEGEEKLSLYGSYRGEVKKNTETIRVSSESMLADGRLILAGYGERLYYSFSTLSANFLPACELFECKTPRLRVEAPDLEGYSLFFSLLGLDVPAQDGNLYVVARGIPYRLRVEGKIKVPCIMEYILWTDLGENFSGEATLKVKTRRVSIHGVEPRAYLRLYSERLQLGGRCESSAKREIDLPYVEEEDLWVEAVYPEGLTVGALLRAKENSLSMPNIDLKVRDFSMSDGVLTFRFERLGFNGWCSLELRGGQERIFIDRIPPWRSYFKLKVSSVGWYNLPDYRIRCTSEDKSAYVERWSVKSFEVF